MKILKGFATALLWTLVLLSFTANALILRLILDARIEASQGLKLGAQAVGELQASALTYTLHVDREAPVSVVIPAGTSLATTAGNITLAADVAVPGTVKLQTDVPVVINIADTPLNASLLNAKDFLDQLVTQWERDPIQVFIAPLPSR